MSYRKKLNKKIVIYVSKSQLLKKIHLIKITLLIYECFLIFAIRLRFFLLEGMKSIMLFERLRMHVRTIFRPSVRFSIDGPVQISF